MMYKRTSNTCYHTFCSIQVALYPIFSAVSCNQHGESINRVALGDLMYERIPQNFSEDQAISCNEFNPAILYGLQRTAPWTTPVNTSLLSVMRLMIS